MPNMEVFDPVEYSVEENAFLIAHAGEPPEVAGHAGYPVGVNPRAVNPVLDRWHRLELNAQQNGVTWVGIEAVKNAAQTYLEQQAQWARDHQHGAPRFPSLHAFDGLGRAHRGGVGSDAGQVRTYFDEDGNRHRLAVELFPNEQPTWKPAWMKKTAEGVAIDIASQYTELIDDGRKLECPVCGFAQNYNADSHSSRSMAKARVMKHLGGAEKDPDAHRALLMHLRAGASA